MTAPFLDFRFGIESGNLNLKSKSQNFKSASRIYQPDVGLLSDENTIFNASLLNKLG